MANRYSSWLSLKNSLTIPRGDKPFPPNHDHPTAPKPVNDSRQLSCLSRLKGALTGIGCRRQVSTAPAPQSALSIIAVVDYSSSRMPSPSQVLIGKPPTQCAANTLRQFGSRVRLRSTPAGHYPPGACTASQAILRPVAENQTLRRSARSCKRKVSRLSHQAFQIRSKSPRLRCPTFEIPKIRAWVAELAKGICEGCGQKAPFEVDGLPFLEVHHVKHLAQQGSDSITNAVALCPNCHRRCHFASDKEAFTLSLYGKVSRLIAE